MKQPVPAHLQEYESGGKLIGNFTSLSKDDLQILNAHIDFHKTVTFYGQDCTSELLKICFVSLVSSYYAFEGRTVMRQMTSKAALLTFESQWIYMMMFALPTNILMYFIDLALRQEGASVDINPAPGGFML